jgi:hypothetical protein
VTPKTGARSRQSGCAPYRAKANAGLNPGDSEDPVFASMNEGSVSSPVLRRDGAWLREVVARRHGCRRRLRPDGLVAALWTAGGSVMAWSSAHVSIASSTFEDLVLSGLAPVAHVKNRLSGSQANNGACPTSCPGNHGPARGSPRSSQSISGAARFPCANASHGDH